MRLFDVPMIKNHSYMMYLKNVTTPDRLSDLNWIFTKIKILLFFANFLTKFLKDLLTKQAKIVMFSFFLKPFLNLFASSPHYDMFTVLKCYHRLFIAEKLRSACLKYASLWKLKYAHIHGLDSLNSECGN